jgi:bisanhydrobacterioruberin hydratase
MMHLSKHQLRILLVFCCAVYFFGVLGMVSPAAAWFISLTPMSLLLSIFTLWLHQTSHTRKTTMYWLIAFLVGFGIEVIGVNTGWPFGHYVYGNVLGPKLMNTPYLLGVNWTLITYCSFYLVDRLLPNVRTGTFVPIAALLPTAIDYLIEPVAIKLDMWTWPTTTTPPLQNYLGWYGTSFVLAIVWRLTMPRSLDNPAAMVLLALQIGFFALLAILFR